MTVKDMKDMVMHQFNLEEDDVSDYVPYLIVYLNGGYGRLVYAWDEKTLGDPGYPRLQSDSDVPNIPEQYHQAIVDWATWCMYRNGNSPKQQRGYAYRDAYFQVESEVIAHGGKEGKELGEVNALFNIPD